MKKWLVIFLGIVFFGFLGNFFSTPKVNKEGQMLYQNNCASCHGQEGKGEGALKGTALNNPQFLNTVTNTDLSRYIKFGRPGTLMTPYATKLTDAEIDSIINYIRDWQSEEIVFKKPQTVVGDESQGKELYQLYCASCHAADGRGKKAMGTALNNPQYLMYTSDEQIWISIAYGREQTAMGPALKGQNGIKQLTEEEISHIVKYIRTFQK